MNTENAISEYAAKIDGVAAYAKWQRDCAKAEADALFDALHGGTAKHPTNEESEKARCELERETGKPPTSDEVKRRIVQDRAESNKPPKPNVETGVIMPLVCAMESTNNADPFDAEWKSLLGVLDMSGLPDRVYNGIARNHQEFVAACASGDWQSVQESAERLAAYLHNATNAAEQNAQTDKKPSRERAPGMDDKTVAGMFNAKAQPLVRRVIKNNGDEKGEYTAAVKESRDKGEKGGMIEAYGGYCIYEPKRGGDRSGYVTYGNLSVAGFRKWLKRHPDQSKRQPDCGFHAGMLADPAALKTCADIWGKHCTEYARQFYEWRQIHRKAPKGQFRFKASQTVHGAEKMAATP